MRFFLKAEPKFNGRLRIVEWYEFPSASGTPFFIGKVDEGVKQKYAREYAEFRALVDANQERMYDEARSEYLAEGGH